MTKVNLELLKKHEEDNVQAEVKMLTQNGLGFGSGKISVEARMERGDLSNDAMRAAQEIILHDKEVFTKIDPRIADDGCGDGRPTTETYVEDDEGNRIYYNKSYARAKVFGGGLVVASSMWRAMRGQPQNETVFGDRQFVAGKLRERGIQHGAHRGDHASGSNCGCGAIDGYDETSYNVIRDEPDIRKALAALYGDSLAENQAAIDQVFASYGALKSRQDYFADSKGTQTMSLLEKDGAVIKKLGGEHNEALFVLNDIEGTTFDQPAFDKALKDKGIEESIQVFAVDTWRGRMYADAMAEIAIEEGVEGNIDDLRRVAFADFLIRTLAVTGTLTAGDLPGAGRMRVGQQDFALAS